MVVHASGVTATARMFPVLADTSVAGADVAALLSVLLETGSHVSVFLETLRFEPSLSLRRF